MLTFLYILIVTHITIICVTLYLHRSQAHRSVTFHPFISNFMRFWLWLTTGMVTKEWVAIHRAHHRYTDDPNMDPHSPHRFGIWHVLLNGAILYNKAAQDRNLVHSYGAGTPNDWIENNLYTPHNFVGIGILLLISILLFGWIGLLVWAIQMFWIPFHAAGVINGLGHYFGYRNWQTDDRSTNIVPFGLWIGGEELHNNHHNSPASPKLSNKWYEIDLGWVYIKLLSALGLAAIKKVDN
jgi:stearoyl-CoA desaturase (delta-9 desaturase)